MAYLQIIVPSMGVYSWGWENHQTIGWGILQRHGAM
jgi:hypothetical protein